MKHLLLPLHKDSKKPQKDSSQKAKEKKSKNKSPEKT